MRYDNNNIIAEGRGRVGKLYFRQMNGRMYASSMPGKRNPEKITAAQRASCNEFARVAGIVKEMLRNDPSLKVKYAEIARRLGLRHAHSALLTAYRRKAVFRDIDRSRYNGTLAGTINVRIRKRDFELNEIYVWLLNPDGTILEEGHAALIAGSGGVYVARVPLANPETITIKIRAVDTDATIIEEIDRPGGSNIVAV